MIFPILPHLLRDLDLLANYSAVITDWSSPRADSRISASSLFRCRIGPTRRPSPLPREPRESTTWRKRCVVASVETTPKVGLEARFC